MKSFSFAKALVTGSFLCLALPVACGDSEENPTPNPNVGGEASGGEPGRTGGEPGMSGGAEAAGGAAPLPPGISLMPTTIECGGDCESARVGLGPTMSYYINPCCAAGDVCGLSTEFLASVGATFEETCQPKDQPGEPDEACPSPDASMIPAGGMVITLDAFPGCCLPSGVCGVAVNDVTAGGGILPLGSLEMGCVEAAPFFPAGTDPVPCGEGVGGSGAGGSDAGGSDAGGMPATAGGDGAGGASGGVGGAG